MVLIAMITAVDRRVGGVTQLVSLEGLVVSIPPLLARGEPDVAPAGSVDLVCFSILLFV